MIDLWETDWRPYEWQLNIIDLLPRLRIQPELAPREIIAITKKVYHDLIWRGSWNCGLSSKKRFMAYNVNIRYTGSVRMPRRTTFNRVGILAPPWNIVQATTISSTFTEKIILKIAIYLLYLLYVINRLRKLTPQYNALSTIIYAQYNALSLYFFFEIGIKFRNDSVLLPRVRC